MIRSFSKWDEFRERRDVAVDHYIEVRKMSERVRAVAMQIEIY
jgi:uncharacterized coiled-coil DUF342 family protein